MLRRIFCALCTSALMASPALAQKAPDSLSFGIISTESSSNLKSAWQPLIDDFSQAIGMPVKPFFASDYAGIIEGMRFNKVHVAWYGNKSAMEAVDRAQGEVFASVIDKDGNPGYWSVLLVKKDSPYTSVQDIIQNAKNLSFGTGDPNSTSGSLVPGYYLWAANQVDPKAIFKVVRTANHESNLLSVINGQVDVAVNNTEAMERYRNSTGRNAEDVVRVVWKSPLIPADPMVWRSDLPADLKQKIRDFFFHYGLGENAQAQRQRDVLLALTYRGFRASDNRQLLPIRQLELAREKARLQADAHMKETDRAQRVAQLDSQLADLQQQIDALPKP